MTDFIKATTQLKAASRRLLNAIDLADDLRRTLAQGEAERDELLTTLRRIEMAAGGVWCNQEWVAKTAAAAIAKAQQAAPVQRLAAVEAERDALRADAERYRWLRNRACHGPHERFVSEYGWFDVSGQHEPGFDAAIDAAMKGGGNG